ncbi:Hypothetical predicted protein [Xyrichtys novacula]|uniref:Uncharacterized protein n=1 Tax=Xyrichtys novacula TaxID=13765 RepID=A0AAV1GG45_XYRNO|nr:Hypothetical predicted protein [Xyrichtys novacula]
MTQKLFIHIHSRLSDRETSVLQSSVSPGPPPPQWVVFVSPGPPSKLRLSDPSQESKGGMTSPPEPTLESELLLIESSRETTLPKLYQQQQQQNYTTTVHNRNHLHPTQEDGLVLVLVLCLFTKRIPSLSLSLLRFSGPVPCSGRTRSDCD